MTYTLTDNGEVVLQMSQDDYARLLAYVTLAAGAQPDPYRVIAFLNEINATNPNWAPL